MHTSKTFLACGRLLWTAPEVPGGNGSLSLIFRVLQRKYLGSSTPSRSDNQTGVRQVRRREAGEWNATQSGEKGQVGAAWPRQLQRVEALKECELSVIRYGCF